MKNPLYIIFPILGLLLLANHAQAGIIIRPVINTGLVGYWDFNEGAGTTVYDKSGKGNNGTWLGTEGSHWVDGKIGKGGTFDTLTSVSFGNSSDLEPTKLTISLWVKRTATWNHDDGQTFFWTKSAWDGNGWYFESYDDGASYLEPLVLCVNGGNYFRISGRSDDVFPLNEWTHVAGSFDSATNEGKLYINGVSQAVQTVGTPDAITATNNPKLIGEWHSLHDLTGQIDEVRVYNRALSESEISRLYKLSSSKIGVNSLGLVSPDLPANATISYVREDCTGYSPCYNTLSAWEAAFGGFGWDGCTTGDLTCLGKTAVAKIDGTWNSPDTTATTITGWTTDANNYIHIYTTASARHPGKWDETKYRLETNGDSMSIAEEYVHIDGVQFKMTTSADYRQIIYTTVNNTNSSIGISNNIFRGVCSSSLQDCEGLDGSWEQIVNLKIWNNIFYRLDRGIKAQSGVIAQIYNNTVVNCSYGFYRNGGPVMILKNNISYNNTDNYNGTFDDYSTNNLSGPGSDAQCPSTNSRNGVRVNFVDEANDDFHLSSADSGARNYGLDLSNDASISYPFDIDRQPRKGTWDIGADEAKGTVVGASQKNQVSDGLVGYWSFNGPDIDGNNAYDRSGQGNNGTITGAIPDGGKVGQALNFDGTNDYIGITDNSVFDLNASNSYSWSFWVNPEDFTFDDWHTVWSQDFSSSVYFYIYSASLDYLQWGPVTNGLAIGWMNTSSDYIMIETSNNALTLNTWNHVVVTYDGSKDRSNRLKAYVNSIDMTTGTEYSGYIGNISALNTRVGANQVFGEYFDGLIDEVRIYNRTLSAEEIRRLYNLGR